MSTSQPGVIRRFFRGLWNAINFTRRLVFNLVFLVILLAFVGAFLAKRPAIAPRTALVLDPGGAIVEQYSTDPTQRALANIAGNDSPEVQLRDLLRAIDSAAKDSRIERIVLVPDEIASIGLATARELGAALDRFKASGKEVIALSAGMMRPVFSVPETYRSWLVLSACADRRWRRSASSPFAVNVMQSIGQMSTQASHSMHCLSVNTVCTSQLRQRCVSFHAVSASKPSSTSSLMLLSVFDASAHGTL